MDFLRYVKFETDLDRLYQTRLKKARKLLMTYHYSITMRNICMTISIGKKRDAVYGIKTIGRISFNLYFYFIYFLLCLFFIIFLNLHSLIQIKYLKRQRIDLLIKIYLFFTSIFVCKEGPTHPSSMRFHGMLKD